MVVPRTYNNVLRIRPLEFWTVRSQNELSAFEIMQNELIRSKILKNSLVDKLKQQIHTVYGKTNGIKNPK